MSDDALPVPPGGIDFYTLLGVDTEATTDDIKDAYRELARYYHPDTQNGLENDTCRNVMKRLQQAERVLTDPRKRQRYDQDGHEMFTGEPLRYTRDGGTGVAVDWRSGDFSKKSSNDSSSASSDSGGGGVFSDIEPESGPDIDVSNIGRDDEEIVKGRQTERERQSEYGKQRDEPAEQQTVEKETPQPTSTKQGESSPGFLTSFRKTLARANSFVSDDVCSLAMRRAWASRTLATLGTFVLFSTLGGLFSIDLFGGPFNPLDGNTDQLGVLLLVALVLIFVTDQIKTESDVSRGGINAASPPRLIGVTTLSINAIAVIGVGAVLVQNGVDLWDFAADFLLSGQITPEQLATSPLRTAAGLLATFGALCGLTAGIQTISRTVWYNRYAKGYHVLPGIWDTLLALPITLLLWMAATDLNAIGIPILPDVMRAVLGGSAGAFGVTQTGFTIYGVWWLVVTIAPLIGGVLLARVGIEYLVFHRSR